MKLKQVIHRVTHTLGTLALLGVGHAYAALPAVAPPTTAASSTTNWLDWFRVYGKDALLVIALLVMAYGLVQVVGKVMSMYGDLSSGRVTWGDIGGAAVGGAVVLMFGTVLTSAAILII